MVKDPQQLHMVLSTGRLEALTQGPQKERLNISSENERLSNGQPCTAIITDNHPLHIMENSSVLDSPEARENPEVVQAVTMHLLEHQQLWETAPPSLLAAKGVPPPPMGMMPPPGGPPGASGPPGAAGKKGPPEGDPNSMPPEPAPGGDPSGQAGKQPSMPMMPIDPMTGQRAPQPIGPM